MKMRFGKRAVLLAVWLVIVLMAGQAALAADAKVTYESNANKFVFLPDNDLFQNFKGVMPGDTLTQDIRVKNAKAKRMKVRIYLRAEPVGDQYRDFLEQMTLKVVQDGDSELFSAAADRQDGLTDDVCLGTFSSGADVDLRVSLTVPLSMDNEFQDAEGIVNWVFTAKEIPDKPEKHTPRPTVAPVLNPAAPKTGDTAAIAVFIILGAMSAAAIIALLLVRRRGPAQR